MTTTTQARFEVFPDRAGGWRFRLIAANGETIIATSQAYATPSSARRAVRQVQATAWVQATAPAAQLLMVATPQEHR